MSSNADPSESQTGVNQPDAPDLDSKDIIENSSANDQPSDAALKLKEDTATTQSSPEEEEEEETDIAIAMVDRNPIRSDNGANSDPKTREAQEPRVESNDSEETTSQLRKGQGSRTFTVREMLNELKNGEVVHQDSDAATSHSQESTQHIEQNDAAMELLDSFTGGDEDSRSRRRILAFAAKRYSSALERNPDDYDALYNWALVLQESADNVSPDSVSPSKDSLLEEACKKYEAATHLCPTLNDAYYNWALAISDRAKMRGRTKEAEELWKQYHLKDFRKEWSWVLEENEIIKQEVFEERKILIRDVRKQTSILVEATKNYEKAVYLNWNSPQALNNWGLALQELSAIVPAREKQYIVKTAIRKFRAAIELQFDFHRAIYNLGTVLYGLAEDLSRSGGPINAKKVSPNELYSQSAIYIVAAHTLKPNYSVYTSALRLVRSMLPLPYLKVGYLAAPPAGNPVAPHSDWKRSQFVLNHEGLQQIVKVEQKHLSQNLSSKSGDTMSATSKPAIRVDVQDITSVSTCADLTLPHGAGLCIDTIHGSVFLIADSWEYLDGWLDAIRLVYTIFARRKSDVLAGIITG